jgi:hypothetical protein
MARFSFLLPNIYDPIKTIVTIACLGRIDRMGVRTTQYTNGQIMFVTVLEGEIASAHLLVGDLFSSFRITPAMAYIFYLVALIPIILIPARYHNGVGSLIGTTRYTTLGGAMDTRATPRHVS